MRAKTTEHKNAEPVVPIRGPWRAARRGTIQLPVVWSIAAPRFLLGFLLRSFKAGVIEFQVVLQTQSHQIIFTLIQDGGFGLFSRNPTFSASSKIALAPEKNRWPNL